MLAKTPALSFKRMHLQRVCPGIEKYVRVAESHAKILRHAARSHNTRHNCARVDAKPSLRNECGSQLIPAGRNKIPKNDLEDDRSTVS